MEAGVAKPRGAKDPWAEAVTCPTRGRLADNANHKAGGSPGDEGPDKPGGSREYADAVLNPGSRSGRSGLKGLGLKPYWGKLTVRNFRGGAGDVTMGAGMRPASKGVDKPPDPQVGAPALYPADPSSRPLVDGAESREIGASLRTPFNGSDVPGARTDLRLTSRRQPREGAPCPRAVCGKSACTVRRAG